MTTKIKGYDIRTVPKKPCKCGCNELIPEYDIWRNTHDYVHGHSNRGMKRPDSRIRLLLNPISKPMFGSDNPAWKEDDIGYFGKHKRMKNILPKPNLCMECTKFPAKELSNISGEYRLDVTDWQWLCYSCHRRYDGSYLDYKRDIKTGRFVAK
jgi:hypothetical protein